MDGDLKGTFSLPLFNQNFDDESGIQDEELKKAFEEELDKFIIGLNN